MGDDDNFTKSHHFTVGVDPERIEAFLAIQNASFAKFKNFVGKTSTIALENNVLRGMDAIHLGSALALNVDIFVSADARQCAAATQAGLKVVQV